MTNPSPGLATLFPPTRTAGLERLAQFLPRAGADYAKLRNYDHGAGHHHNVSGLSPYLRHRLICEDEVLATVLGRQSLQAADKFVAEVFWRTYWKGWLELRPSIWDDYQNSLQQTINRVQGEAGLRRRWADACNANTGIDCFDAWAQELADTGYLHNHARMWFASIWIFTLQLPWELGADFFLRHLIDGDPASNTLSWRWVAGLHTAGKHYVARADNIVKFTARRFAPSGLAANPAPLQGPPPPQRRALPECALPSRDAPSVFLLHEDDLSPGFALDQIAPPVATACLDLSADRSPLAISPAVADWGRAAMQECVGRWGAKLGPVTQGFCTPGDLADWAQRTGATQIVAPYAPTGPVASFLAALSARSSLPVFQLRRGFDSRAWPHATHGFFRFREAIPSLLAAANIPPG